MSVVQPIGSFIPVDSEGYLVNPCDIKLVPPPWLEVVRVVQDAYISTLENSQSIVCILEVSVAKGSAIAGISDVDTSALFFSQGTELDKAWRNSFQQTLVEQFPFQTGVEMWCIPLDVVRHKPSAGSIRTTIKNAVDLSMGRGLVATAPTIQARKKSDSSCA